MKNITFKKKRSNFKIIGIPLVFKILALVLILGALYYIFSSKILIIKKLDVKLVDVNCTDQEQIKSTSSLLGQNILFITTDQVTQKLTQKFVCIASVNLTKKLPEEVGLEVFGRKPALLISTFSSEASLSAVLAYRQPISSQSAFISESFLIDDQGVVFSKQIDQTSNFKLFVQSNVSVGQRVDKQVIQKVLKAFDKVRLFGVPAQEGWLYLGRYLLFETEPKIVFSVEEKKDLNLQLASLQLILDKAKIDSVKIDFIDLRFDKSIVKFLPKNKND